MTTESELKQRCTPEIIKSMCELAEGFAMMPNGIDRVGFKNTNDTFPRQHWINIDHLTSDPLALSTLIHRAIDGWNDTYNNIAFYPDHLVKNWNDGHMNRCNYPYRDYKPQSLTQAECAMLDCLIEIIEEEMR